MSRFILLFYILFVGLFGQSLQAQYQAKWMRQKGTESNERLFAIAPVASRGVVAAGEHYAGSKRTAFPYLIRVDGQGQVLWERHFESTLAASLKAVCSTEKGSIYAAGLTRDNKYDPYTDFYLLKTNKSGDLLWQKSIQGAGYDQVNAMLFHPPSQQLILAGYQDIKYYGEHHGVVLRLDTLGNTVWKYVYSGSYGEEILSITATADGGFVFAGFENAETYGERMVLVGKIDAAGQQVWVQNFDLGAMATANTISELADGSLMVSGFVREENAPVHDVMLMQLTATGEKVWHKIFRQQFDEEAASHIVSSRNTIVLLAYIRDRMSDNADIWLLETNLQGEVLWEDVLPRGSIDFGQQLAQTPQGGIVVGGSTFHHMSQNWDAAFMQFDATRAPVVRFDHPHRLGASTNDELYRVEAQVFSADTLVSVQMLLNGRSIEHRQQVLAERSSNGNYQLAIEADARLNEGANFIQLRAANAFGETLTQLHRVSYFRLPDANLSHGKPRAK